MNERAYTLQVNSFEVGVLMGAIIQLDDRTKRALKPVYEQLVALINREGQRL